MINYTISGNDMQVLILNLQGGDKIYAEPGHVVYKDVSVKFDMKAKGGILKSISRSLTGSDFFVAELEGPGVSTMSGFMPGKIIPLELNNNSILVEHTSFLAAEESVEYGASLARLSAGILGGEGLFMARFSGIGMVWLHAIGGLVQLNLAEGQEVQIEASHLLAFDEGMQYGITRVGGLKTMILSGLEGEGLFFVNIKGPGRVFMHAVSRLQLAASLLKVLKV
ncbi:TIGR00266 family protein [Sulfuracidifex tepidarius]|uniref:TIGR00266 family protein n=1 Tax=Sulfuracidifex tepidarius TaxID=1294262 RepID=A0A510E660_9CREN|nr:TIGR00266 family protein [Sulfuracidifex tepidarius]BBG27966.1 hypothetical protein IC007_2521 [Sulfuracidifex tepidarius]